MNLYANFTGEHEGYKFCAFGAPAKVEDGDTINVWVYGKKVARFSPDPGLYDGVIWTNSDWHLREVQLLIGPKCEIW